MNKNINGIGFLLKTPQNTFLFQERDQNTQRNPGMIAPFGGGVEQNETPIECAIRELQEELELTITPKDLREVGLFQSHFNPGTYIQIYLVEKVNPKNIVLHEGKNVKEMSIQEALHHPKVTDFTKGVLDLFKSGI